MKLSLGVVMMGIGIALVLIAAVIMTSVVINQPQPVPVTSPTPTLQVSYPVIMPEDLGRLEAEVYAVCKQYAGLDLSGMVSLCKRVGFQE